MANWDDIMSNCLTMGRSRQLCYAANAERRRRESEEVERGPGTRPLIGRGVGPVPPRLLSWERPWEENFHITLARGRSRPTYTSWPFLQIHHSCQPHSLPHCTVAGFGYADANIPCPPRVNNPGPCLSYPQPYVLPPPPPQDQDADAESSPSESPDSEEGDSLKVNHSSP